MRLFVAGSTRTMSRLVPQHRDALGVWNTPRGGNRANAEWAQGLPWAADNDCFNGFHEPRFLRMLDRLQTTSPPGCVFVAAPDVVGDSRATLDLFPWWGLLIRSRGFPVALVGQDGAEDRDIPWDSCDAWFVGGSDDWKLTQASCDLVQEAKRRGKWVHMGRVNSIRRLTVAFDWGCDSVDGGSMSRWSDLFLPWYLAHVGQLQRQGALWP